LRATAREKLEIVLFTSAFWRGGRKGGSGGIPPAEPVNKIGSDFFKYTPPVGKSCCWFALYEGSPADGSCKIEFFVFVPFSGTAEAAFLFLFSGLFLFSIFGRIK